MENWGLHQMTLDKCIYDYMKANNLQNTAESFAREVGIHPGLDGINSPEGLLEDWWSRFWTMFTSRNSEYNNQDYPITAGEPVIDSPHIAGATTTEQVNYGVPRMSMDSMLQLMNVAQLSRPQPGLHMLNLVIRQVPNLKALVLGPVYELRQPMPTMKEDRR